MEIPKGCIECPVTSKAQCFECWKKKVRAGEMKLTPVERAEFDLEYGTEEPRTA